MDAVRKLILERLDELGLTMAEASMKIGRNHAYLQQFLKRGIPAELHERDRERLSELLKVPQEKLRGASAPLPKRDYNKAASGRESLVVIQGVPPLVSEPTNQQNTPVIVPGTGLIGNADLPVFGTAQGGHGALIVTDQAVDWVVRPDPLLRVREGYGMIVTGDSMTPAHKSGSIALVNPHLPFRPGDTCVFRRHDDDGTVFAVIKELIGVSDTTWRVRQYNPKKDFTLKRAEWQVCHVTVGNFFRR